MGNRLACIGSSAGTEALVEKTLMQRIFCDGVNRRDFLRLGTASVLGSGLALPSLLARQAQAVAAGKAKRDLSLIYLFLHGGLSTIDTWDPKPEAPTEFRGEFKTISTNVPGIVIGEHTPGV